jgi:hypothetical protein
VASARVPTVRGVEEPSQGWSTDRPSRGPHVYSHDVGRESLVGAPRIHGELLKLGFTVSQTTVATYMVRHRPLLSQTWRTFLTNHAHQLIAADFFVVPTATCQLLFVLVLSHMIADASCMSLSRTSHGSLDRPTAARRVSLGRSASISHSRPRSCV